MVADMCVAKQLGSVYLSQTQSHIMICQSAAMSLLDILVLIFIIIVCCNCVQVQLWDTAGSEKFHKITQSYYRGVHGIMLVYDVSNRKSFKHVSYWLSNISKNANENVQVLLVGNKVDLRLETKKDPNAPSKINKFIKRGNKNSAEVEGGGETVEAEKDPFVQTYEGSNVASR